MREIKFQIYCQMAEGLRKYEVTGIEYKQYGEREISKVHIGDYSIDGQYLKDGLAHLVQFTGLFDKNQVPIYEGDILRYPAANRWEETSFVGYEVFYHDNDYADRHIGFQMNRMHFYGNLCGGECKAWLLPKYTSQMIITGNIYEGATHENQ